VGAQALPSLASHYHSYSISYASTSDVPVCSSWGALYKIVILTLSPIKIVANIPFGKMRNLHKVLNFSLMDFPSNLG
jgi:hypothetical protein